MSILNHSPTIVRDGLVMCLDAGAVRSYPGAGPQLVVNGDFASDITTGWEEGEATVSHDTTGGDGARLKIVGSVTGRLYSSAAITTVPGQKYRFSVHVTGTSTNHFVHLGKAKGGSDILQNFTLGSADGTYVWDFVATSTTSNELWIHLGATGSSTQYYDQVSLVAIASNLSLPGDSGFSSGVSYGVPGANQWSDLSGNNNNGTLNNMQYDLDAESGAGGTRSFDFDGSSDYVNLGAGSSLNFGTGDVTMDAWVKTTQSSEGQILRVSYTSPYVLFGVASGKLRAAIHDGTTAANDENNNGPTVNDGDWHHVAAVFNRIGNIVFYKDAVATTGVSMSSVTDSIGAPNPYAAISRRPNSDSQYFDGKITCVRAYNRALTAAEIQQNYRTHKGRFGK